MIDPNPDPTVKITPEIVWSHIQKFFSNPTTSSRSMSFCVGYSGGLDSTVLLHLLTELRSRANIPFQLKAIHVNHQLHVDADHWSEACASFCKNLNVPFQAINVVLTDANKLGIEASARNARYEAFKTNLCQGDILLTGHHLDDQVETLFLQLLRGTGIEGAAAMNSQRKFGSYDLVRPLLSVERKQLQEYAQRLQLPWIDDSSNSETQYNRNYLRHEILPKIESRWPAYRKTIQRFTVNARNAGNLLDEYVDKDFADCLNGQDKTLKISRLVLFEQKKQRIIVRFWIKRLNFSIPSDAQLNQIFSAIFSDVDAQPKVAWGNVQLRRYRDKLYLLSRIDENIQLGDHDWNVKEELWIKGVGTLRCEQILGQGIHHKYIKSEIKIVFRRGGEKCRPVNRQGTHSLKKLFQEYGVPPWLRDRVPLLMIDKQIAVVMGLCYCAPFVVEENEMGNVFRLNAL